MIYKLGEHIIAQGDSTDAEFVSRVAIACEHLGRRCLGIELDEGYVKTAVARWEKLTGLTAVLMDPEGKQATTMSHTGRLRAGRGIAMSQGNRAKKGEKIGIVRV